MTSNLAILPRPTAYEALKAAVDSSHADLERAWIQHTKAVRDLQDSGTWKQYAPTWREYCNAKDEQGNKLYVPYDDSTYRAYFPAAVVAELASTVTTITLSKADSRVLQKRLSAICKDETLLGQTYERAYRETKKVMPTEGELKATYAVLKRRKDTGIVTVNGLDFAVEDEATQAAIAEELWGLGERKQLHIEEGSVHVRRTLEMAQKEAIGLFFDYSSAKTSNTLFDFIFGYKEKKV